MKINIYLLVFGVMIAIFIIAAFSTIFFNKNLTNQNVSSPSLPNYGPAPEIQGIAAWINSQPLTLASLKGKVVLVDFWTYSCINCIRSIPHIEAWYNKYGNNGLVIIGVHTPEFAFEKNYANVNSAVQKFGITYPVALDSNYSTWQAYNNHYWPADYLLDGNGNARQIDFGEGNYNKTEKAIRALLQSAGYPVPQNATSVPLGVNFSGIGTPEIYVGYQAMLAHNNQLGNTQNVLPNQNENYVYNGIKANNTVYLSGTWLNMPDSIVALNNSKVFLTYQAGKLNVVAGIFNVSSSRLVVKLDGNNLQQMQLGADTSLSAGTASANVTISRLYNLVSTGYNGWHTIEIDAARGFRLYTFTFS